MHIVHRAVKTYLKQLFAVIVSSTTLNTRSRIQRFADRRDQLTTSLSWCGSWLKLFLPAQQRDKQHYICTKLSRYMRNATTVPFTSFSSIIVSQHNLILISKLNDRMRQATWLYNCIRVEFILSKRYRHSLHSIKYHLSFDTNANDGKHSVARKSN